MSNRKSLYIPVRIKRHQEVLNIDGIGKKEAKNIIIFSIIGLIIGTSLAIIFQNPLCFLIIFIFFSGGSYLLQKKDDTNQNTVGRVRLLREFKRSQKQYFYVYHNIYEK